MLAVEIGFCYLLAVEKSTAFATPRIKLSITPPLILEKHAVYDRYDTIFLATTIFEISKVVQRRRETDCTTDSTTRPSNVRIVHTKIMIVEYQISFEYILSLLGGFCFPFRARYDVSAERTERERVITVSLSVSL